MVYTNTDKHTLRFNQIKKFEGAYIIKFLSYKHSAHCTQTFQLLPHQDLSNCPVQAMDNYLNKRGTSDGLLFIMQNSKPINRSQFTKILKQCLELTGLKGRYNTHSFRIGRTTELASRNFSEEIIRISGMIIFALSLSHCHSSAPVCFPFVLYLWHSSHATNKVQV